jgi:hypothetical protein
VIARQCKVRRKFGKIPHSTYHNARTEHQLFVGAAHPDMRLAQERTDADEHAHTPWRVLLFNLLQFVQANRWYIRSEVP